MAFCRGKNQKLFFLSGLDTQVSQVLPHTPLKGQKLLAHGSALGYYG